MRGALLCLLLLQLLLSLIPLLHLIVGSDF